MSPHSVVSPLMSPHSVLSPFSYLDNEDSSFLLTIGTCPWNSTGVALKTTRTFVVTALRTSKIKIKEYRLSFTWVSLGQLHSSFSGLTLHTLQHGAEFRKAFSWVSTLSSWTSLTRGLEFMWGNLKPPVVHLEVPYQTSCKLLHETRPRYIELNCTPCPADTFRTGVARGKRM